MKVVLQRVKEASVTVQGKEVARIGRGVCLFVGVEKGDTEKSAEYLAGKTARLRIFPDEADRMNLSLLDVSGGVLAVSQFTLAGSVKKGRRPSFDKAEDPARAEQIFRTFVDEIRAFGLKVESGIFGAVMEVRLINDGPVTFVLEDRQATR
ncbi:MAG: D-aminoacyl-tRNA deacylase [Candidatus Aminicenantales bacterium]